jgi:hypothetical protein
MMKADLDIRALSNGPTWSAAILDVDSEPVKRQENLWFDGCDRGERHCGAAGAPA